MSKSFAIVGGDLSVSARSFATVRGKEKLMQDLRSWLLERIGTDPATPSFGSSLNEEDNFLGNILSQRRVFDVRNEVTNLLTRYQQLQLTKMQADSLDFEGKTVLDNDEMIEEISSVEVTSSGTLILVRVLLSTVKGNTIQLTLPVES